MFKTFLKKKKPTLVLNGVLIENQSGRITAYFEEFPDIVAEGDNEDNAKDNLVEALMMVAQFKVKQRMDSTVSKVEVANERSYTSIKHFHQQFGQLQAH